MTRVLAAQAAEHVAPQPQGDQPQVRQREQALAAITGWAQSGQRDGLMDFDASHAPMWLLAGVDRSFAVHGAGALRPASGSVDAQRAYHKS